jgi:hypothetical protein
LENYEKILKEKNSKKNNQESSNESNEIKNPKPIKNKDKMNYEALCRGENVADVIFI